MRGLRPVRRATRLIAGSIRGASAGVAGLHVVVEDDTVVVVNNLGFVAELDRFAELALRDRPGVGVVQAGPPGRPVRGDPGQPLPSLGRDPSGRLQQPLKIVDGTGPGDPDADPRPGPAGRRVAPWFWLSAAPVSRWPAADRLLGVSLGAQR